MKQMEVMYMYVSNDVLYGVINAWCACTARVTVVLLSLYTSTSFMRRGTCTCTCMSVSGVCWSVVQAQTFIALYHSFCVSRETD